MAPQCASHWLQIKRASVVRLQVALSFARFASVFLIHLGAAEDWWNLFGTVVFPPFTLELAIRGAAKAAASAGHLEHGNVAGGAGAYLSSLKRIGWY